MRRPIGWLLFAIMVMGFAVSPAQADETPYEDTWKYRAEGSLAFEGLTNNYGFWEGVDTKLYARINRKVTLFGNAIFWDREAQLSGLAGVGAYIEWLSFLYTYTSVYGGTNDPYNPLIRVDHDFNFKVGKDGFVVLTLGAMYLKYHSEHWDIAPYAGVSAYLGPFVLGYRLIVNISNPDAVVGLSHLATLDYGTEGDHSSYLAVNYGKSAYSATYLTTPQEIRQNSLRVGVGHRHWIKNNWGLFGELNFLWLEQSYEKFGGMFGVFFTWGHLPYAEE